MEKSRLVEGVSADNSIEVFAIAYGSSQATHLLARFMKHLKRSNKTLKRSSVERRRVERGAASRRKETTKPSDPRTVADARTIDIDAIDWSHAIRSINVEHLERLAGAVRVPAIKVWEIRPGEFRGIDGYHRWQVAKDRGIKTVLAVILRFPAGEEGERAFDVECIRSNIQHGLPFTKAERASVIRRFWFRWGRAHGRPGGETLEDLGKLFGLTRQRIHQILTTGTKGEMERTRGFSSFGRFSAAARRLSTLLGDTGFLQGLLGHERQAEVVTALQELRARIDGVLKAKSSEADANDL